jgi:TRAP-type C4-dicarboxylate transport system permease small subunit
VILRWLQRADSAGRWLENALLVLLFTAILGLSTTQILLRNFFARGLFWADELVRLLVLWLAVAGALAATRDRRHIAIELIVRSLPNTFERAARSIVALFAAGVSSVFAYQSYRFVIDSRDFGDTVLGNWPAWYFQLILPVGFALIAWRFLTTAIGAWLPSRA